MKKIVLAFVSVLLLVSTGTPVSAHGSAYIYETWAAGSVVQVQLSSNNSWTTAQINAVKAAISEVNSQYSAAVPTLSYKNQLRDWNGCTGAEVDPTINFVLIEKVGGNWLGDSAVAETALCQNLGHVNLWKTWTQIETPSNTYWGTAIPEPSGTRGMEGILVHELVHSLGFYPHFPDSQDICQYSIGSGTYHTMCAGPYYNGTDLQYNRNITLEEHDLHTIELAY